MVQSNFCSFKKLRKNYLDNQLAKSFFIIFNTFTGILLGPVDLFMCEEFIISRYKDWVQFDYFPILISSVKIINVITISSRNFISSLKQLW